VPLARLLSRAAATLLALCALAAPALAQPKAGGTLRFVMKYEPPTLAAINNSSTPTTSPKIFDGLLTYDDELKPLPQLATAWAISPDGLEYRFTLREGVTWHDGKPFTSADVAFSILRLKQAHPRGRATFANVERVDTPDAQTAVIRLGKPSPFLLVALGPSESPMVPRHLYEGVDPATPPGPQLHVGTGPFLLKEWVRGSHAVLERNPNYWDKPKPYLDRVIIRFMPDAAARAAGFEAGDIDLGGLAPVPLSDMERFKADRRFTVDTRSFAYSGNQNQLLFNLDSEPMKNRKLREAIAHSLDLEAIAKTVFYGYALPSPSPVSVALKPFHNPEVKARKFDLALANRLLDEAALPRGPNGTRIQLRLTYNPFVDPRFADFIRQSLRRVGIDAVVQNYEFAAYVKAVYTDRAFDITLESLVNAFDPTVGVQRVYWSKNFRIGLPFSNASHYASAEADRLLEAAAVENDFAKRRQLFFDFQKVVHDDLPSVDLVSALEVIIANHRLRNYTAGAEGLGSNFADVYFAN